MASAGKGNAATQHQKRILIIVENLPVPFDRRVWLEAKALKEAGYSVRIICPRMKGFTRLRESLDGIEIYRHPLPYEAVSGVMGFIIEYATALAFETILTLWIFLRHGLDAIHACNPPDTIFLIGLLLKPFKVKFLYDQHDINPELYQAKYNRSDFLYRILLKLEHLTYQTANVVISTNESYKRIAIERGRKSADDIFIVRSAPDTSTFHAVKPDPTLKNKRKHLVAYLGVMGKQEGIDLLLESIQYIIRDLKRTDISFTLIGSGPELANLSDLSLRLGISDFTIFTGRISDTELLTWLSTADVCVNPDRYNAMNDKSTMNKILEYMAIGKPIVQYDMTEGRYSAGEASLYARPDDPIDFAQKVIDLLDDHLRRTTMGKAGLLRLQQKLDWQFSKQALLQAYTRLFHLDKSGQ